MSQGGLDIEAQRGRLKLGVDRGCGVTSGRRAGTAGALRLVCGSADFSTSVRSKSSEEAFNKPVCSQGRVVPPTVLRVGSAN